MNGLPTVRIDDILIHPRDNDLIVGTHGRSIWIIDDITPLQQMTSEAATADVTLFPPRPAVAWRNDITQSITAGGNKYFRGDNPAPGTAISYHLKSAAAGDVKITITDVTGRVVREMDGTKSAGLNRVHWNLRGNPPQAAAGAAGGRGAGGGGGQAGGGRGGFGGGPAIEPGTYLLKLSVGGKDYTQKIVVEADTY